VSKSKKKCKNGHCSTQINKFLLSFVDFLLNRTLFSTSVISFLDRNVIFISINACSKSYTIESKVKHLVEKNKNSQKLGTKILKMDSHRLYFFLHGKLLFVPFGFVM